MLPKPPSCRGCPAYGDGLGFVPDEIRDDASVQLVFRNPGFHEEHGKRVVGWAGRKPLVEPYGPAPLTGAVGYVLEHDYLPVGGLDREHVSLSNTLRCRWDHTDNMPGVHTGAFKAAARQCQASYFRLGDRTKLLVAAGEHALYALTTEARTERNTVADWRGWALPYSPMDNPRPLNTSVWTPGPDELPVLATYHISYLMRAHSDDSTNPEMWFVSKQDWRKIPRVLARQWPEPFPEIITGAEGLWPSDAAFDTEFDPETVPASLIRWSLATRVNGVPTVWVREARAVTPPGTSARFILHNAPADVRFLDAVFQGTTSLDDTSYAHAVLWPGFPHDLNTLGSLYARTNRWKHLSGVNPVQYAGGDALGTWDLWRALASEFRQDPRSKDVYDLYIRPLIRIITRAMNTGLRIDHERAERHEAQLFAEARVAKLMAQAVAGWPLNIGSDQQMGHWLYGPEGDVPARRKT